MIKHYSNNIQNIIQKELFAAKHSIKICVAWFTNDLLFQPLLLKLNAGVKVELILNKDEINISDTNEVNLDLFIESGGHLYWNESSKLLHHKFCVIDDNVVISGSYNWTNGAEHKNYELITLFKDEAETTTQHLAIFEELTQEFPLAKVETKAEQNHANITTNKSPIPSQQPTYYKVGKFIDGLAIIYRLENGNRRYGFINENNVLVIPCKYESVEEFHNGLSFVCLGHYFGAIDKNGMEIIPFQHKSIRWRNNNFIEAYFDNDELCIYDNSGIRIANNRIIVYTSIDGKTITPDSYSLIILSNTYQCGKGIIIFSNAIKQFSGFDLDEFNNSVYNDWASYDDISGHVSFLQCHRLSSISIPSGITSIGWCAFEGCSSLMNITISNSVTEIGGHAFEDCISLIGVTIPDSVTKIGDAAFSRCSKLTSVTIPNSVTTIGDAAFADCYSLKEFKGKFAADNGRCLIRNNTIIAYVGDSGTTYTIPEGITEIGWHAFKNCTSLLGVTIPNSVTKIGWGAFSGCSSLKSVTIPNSVASIAGYAFSDCSSLIGVTISNSVNKIEDYAFKGCSSLTNITIPKGVTEIGWHAFENCTSLLGVAIPDSVTKIGWGAFENCTSIVSITIPNGVTEIGVGVFGGCYNIRDFKGKFATDGGRCLIKDNTIIAYAGDSGTTYTIPKGVTAIGNNTFRNCSSLLSVTIPDSIFEIDGGMFNGCCNIKEFKGKFAADGGSVSFSVSKQ